MSSIQCTSVRSIYFFIGVKNQLWCELINWNSIWNWSQKQLKSTCIVWLKRWYVIRMCQHCGMVIKTKGEKKKKESFCLSATLRKTAYVRKYRVAAGCWLLVRYRIHIPLRLMYERICMNWDLANVFPKCQTTTI